MERRLAVSERTSGLGGCPGFVDSWGAASWLWSVTVSELWAACSRCRGLGPDDVCPKP